MKVFFSLKSRLFSIHSQPFTHPPLLQNLPIKWLNTNSHDCIFFLCAHLTNTGLVLCSVIGYFEYTQDFPASAFSLHIDTTCGIASKVGIGLLLLMLQGGHSARPCFQLHHNKERKTAYSCLFSGFVLGVERFRLSPQLCRNS